MMDITLWQGAADKRIAWQTKRNRQAYFATQIGKCQDGTTEAWEHLCCQDTGQPCHSTDQIVYSWHSEKARIKATYLPKGGLMVKDVFLKLSQRFFQSRFLHVTWIFLHVNDGVWGSKLVAPSPCLLEHFSSSSCSSLTATACTASALDKELCSASKTLRTRLSRLL